MHAFTTVVQPGRTGRDFVGDRRIFFILSFLFHGLFDTPRHGGHLVYRCFFLPVTSTISYRLIINLHFFALYGFRFMIDKTAVVLQQFRFLALMGDYAGRYWNILRRAEAPIKTCLTAWRLCVTLSMSRTAMAKVFRWYVGRRHGNTGSSCRRRSEFLRDSIARDCNASIRPQRKSVNTRRDLIKKPIYYLSTALALH